MPFFKSSIENIQAFKISPDDTNYFAILVDQHNSGCTTVAVVEIFTVGGRTPPNSHVAADELFYVLSGEGRAHCDGETTDLRKGDALLVRPGSEHVLENTGTSKLYTLTIMIPDEEFGALIRSDQPVTLDAEDIAVLCQ